MQSVAVSKYFYAFRDLASTDPIVFIESCENRCNDDSMILMPGYTVSCDCYEDCVLNNTCCPDYKAICLMGESNNRKNSRYISK